MEQQQIIINDFLNLKASVINNNRVFGLRHDLHKQMI
jgi:hypothetical protein